MCMASGCEHWFVCRPFSLLVKQSSMFTYTGCVNFVECHFFQVLFNLSGFGDSETEFSKKSQKTPQKYVFVGCWVCWVCQLMVYWWFVARWFGYLRFPYERDYYLGQTTNSPVVQYASSHPFFFWRNIISFKQPPRFAAEISLSAGWPFNPTPGGSQKKRRLRDWLQVSPWLLWFTLVSQRSWSKKNCF